MFFKTIAPFYDHFVNKTGMDFRKQLLEWVAPRPGESLLDLGGGTGRNVPVLIARGAKVVILDASEAMLHQARKNHISAELVLGDARQMPFPQDYFDGVLCSDAWHHMPEQPRIARELARVLRSGGRVVMLEFNPACWQGKVIRAVERLFGEPGTFVTPEQLMLQMREVGIIGDIQELGNWQYIFIGKKQGV
ncbi:class I SAM-dependent methyltransferase [Desulforamulus aeronauticus]|uniref:Demethylmenaquinone methyltransferase / 2-methoxy-6-polyprenyl-1,4-benzoquinol methylase n=1 Tax=Desulforamulus aeronauticus DSM 10349 TaxID=1121421 RepID=A0A1M6UFA0_9FIRM|nr:methyltransferase domain-containing protein [Desulforamulus aeronauticus]SHK67860.1 demethylmenaquinone methyltransferase / 2-methoxy-6-polyprenyl-1,4-benzoquinol methylase [Desulforamulus aeronauticus DSM 10349]